MGNDNCGLVGGWPKSKKSKLPVMQEDHSWANLPSLLIHDVFKLLSTKDRLNASSACKAWRHGLFHPSFWQDVKFEIDAVQIPKCQFYIMKAGHIVRNAHILFNSLCYQSVYEFSILLQQLSTNSNLRCLIIEPSHCHIEFEQLLDVNNLLLKVLRHDRLSLEQLSLGGCEDFCNNAENILQTMAQLHPNRIKTLGLASVKDDPGEYAILDCDPTLFQPFQKLQILSVDYDIVSDRFLESLRGASELSRLVIHVHGVWSDHPGTTSNAWTQFTEQHPNCELRLSFIHAYDVVCDMHQTILRPTMPLTHLKVFFCEDLNMNVLNVISSWYSTTLKSIMWVDSRPQTSHFELVHRLQGTQAHIPDPFVMAAWLCRRLEEIVLLGYKYFEEDLIAIARLRGDTLKTLEISEEDIISITSVYGSDGIIIESEKYLTEMQRVLGRTWAPLNATELHPVISDPTAGDSDEYLLPKVFADLY